MTGSDSSKQQYCTCKEQVPGSRPKRTPENSFLDSKSIYAISRVWASNRAETCFSPEFVSERHQPCRPSARLSCCHTMHHLRRVNQGGPKQPGFRNSWRCREVFGAGTLGSPTGQDDRVETASCSTPGSPGLRPSTSPTHLLQAKG